MSFLLLLLLHNMFNHLEIMLSVAEIYDKKFQDKVAIISHFIENQKKKLNPKLFRESLRVTLEVPNLLIINQYQIATQQKHSIPSCYKLHK